MDLCGQLLIAMPGMVDVRFERSVVFICAHSDDGAMGLIINKPAADVTFDQLLDQLNIDRAPDAQDIPVHFGGPVERARGFVLHSRDFGEGTSTLQVDDDFAMTATLDILEALARGKGPSGALLALGYAGWAPGQLEGEILRNDWLTCDAGPDLVFSAPDKCKWAAALKTLGVDPISLSGLSGRA